MAAEKVTLTLRHEELKSLGSFMTMVVKEVLEKKNSWHQMLGYILVSIVKKKMVMAMAFPKPNHKLQFRKEEALAIIIAFDLVDLVDLDNYTAAVMIDISTKLK